jgi:hypothetical protein
MDDASDLTVSRQDHCVPLSSDYRCNGPGFVTHHVAAIRVFCSRCHIRVLVKCLRIRGTRPMNPAQLPLLMQVVRVELTSLSASAFEAGAFASFAILAGGSLRN